MHPVKNRFFDPEGLARLGNRELVARQVVEGFLTGRHRSPYHGFSVEYLDHRAYAFGDDLRALDWKLLARTDKYHVKLFHDETNLRATILLDCSASMSFKSGAAFQAGIRQLPHRGPGSSDAAAERRGGARAL